jgi:seryl-tRNA synthetase
MAQEDEKTVVEFLAEVQKAVRELEKRVDKLTSVVNKNADLLIKSLKQQEKMASMFSDVETLKVTLGTFLRVADEIWKAKNLRVISDRITEETTDED